jgi:hypothetical protein
LIVKTQKSLQIEQKVTVIGIVVVA